MKKRFRDENGKLTMSIEKIEKETATEASSYYRYGEIYLYKGNEFVYLLPVPGSESLAHFQSFDGFNLYIPPESLGTFLPDVASEGSELTLVID